MLHSDTLDCPAAREQLSARLDGELADERALARHLAHCDACREHERALAVLATDFEDLRRREVAVPDLWPRVERRLRFSVARPALTRVAAAVVGFVGLGGATLLVQRAPSGPAPRKHLVQRLLESFAPGARGPDELFAALPEYHLLRTLPRKDTR